MSPDELVLYVESLAGHFILAGLGFVALMILKDVAFSHWKSYKWKKTNNLKEGDSVLLEGHPAIVSKIDNFSVTFTLYNGGMNMRTVSIDKVGGMDVQRVVVPPKELHKHDSE